MSLAVYFVVYGNPVGKGRPRATSRGGFVRMYTDAKTLGYEAAIADEAKRAMGVMEPLETPIQFQMTAYYPIPKSWSKRKRTDALNGELYPMVKPDMDNVIKAVLDACNGIVYLDDTQVVNLVVSKRYSDDPRIECYMREVLK